MRMAGPDVVLFVVGALLFGGASAAIVTSDGGIDALTGGGGSALGVFTVTYGTDVVEGEAQQVADFGSTGPVQFDVNNTRVSKVFVVLSCSDAAVGPAAFQVTVTVEGPNGIATEPQTVACGNVEIPVDVTPVPPATNVQGATQAGAEANIPQEANATKAVGTWKVSVSGQRGGVSPPGGLPVNPGNPSGSIALDVEIWEPTLAPVQK